MDAATVTHPNARQVRRLSLRAQRREDVSRATISIEDALRTASIPGFDRSSWIVIRKLDLGRIPAGLSPTLLSLHIERVAKSIRARAVSFDSPLAPNSNVILFPSRREALFLFASRLINSRPTQDWYWTKLIPSASRSASSPILLASVLSEILREHEAHRAIGSLIRDALRTSNLRLLGEQLSPAALIFWFRKTDIPCPMPIEASDTLEAMSYPVARNAIEKTLEIWSYEDPRTQFIALCSLSIELPRSASLALLATRATQLIQSIDSKKTNFLQKDRADTKTILSQTIPPHAFEADSPDIKSRPSVDPAHPTGKHPEELTDEDAPSEPQADESDFSSVKKFEQQLSYFAGIVLVVSILNRIGFSKYLEKEPALLEQGFPVQLLVHVLERFDCPSSDPILKVLSERSEPCEKLPDATLELWFAALRSWTKRRLKMPLSEVVHRRGLFASTETHIDISFDYSKADIRLRREAIDIDPGWTPFLGWVICIHYIDIHEFND